MKIFFYIEQLILRIFLFGGFMLIGFYVGLLIFGFRNINAHWDTVTLSAVGAFVLFNIIYPMRKFGEYPAYYKNLAKIDPALVEQQKKTSLAVLQTVYSPARAIPRIILYIIQIGLLTFLLKIVFAPFMR